MAVTRYTFLGLLDLEGALHIGSGGGGQIAGSTSLTDAAVVRDSRGRPYIPGSSLRGMLRSVIGQLAPQLGLGELREDAVIEQAVKNNLEQRNLPRTPDEASLHDVLALTLSPAERLFGTVYWSSPLTIQDLPLTGAQDEATEIRHGVGIDRDTGAARDALKYDFEVLTRGLQFEFLMRCDIPSQPETDQQQWLQLIALGLRLLEQGDLQLGGRLARGVGQVRLRDLVVYRLDLSDRRALLGALLSESRLERFGTPLPDGWTSRMLREVV